MLSQVMIIGRLGKVVDEIYRELFVENSLFDDEEVGKTKVERYLVTYWSRNSKAPFYKVKEDYLVAIKGRLTIEDDKGVVIVAEAIDYLDDLM
ncbi:MAG: hypothetical protein ACOX28_00415 [Bacilli bacterium]|jgi:pantothenate kinase